MAIGSMMRGISPVTSQGEGRMHSNNIRTEQFLKGGGRHLGKCKFLLMGIFILLSCSCEKLVAVGPNSYLNSVYLKANPELIDIANKMTKDEAISILAAQLITKNQTEPIAYPTFFSQQDREHPYIDRYSWVTVVDANGLHGVCNQKQVLGQEKISSAVMKETFTMVKSNYSISFDNIIDVNMNIPKKLVYIPRNAQVKEIQDNQPGEFEQLLISRGMLYLVVNVNNFCFRKLPNNSEIELQWNVNRKNVDKGKQQEMARNILAAFLKLKPELADKFVNQDKLTK
jgi:uncharacterized pyridoxamine 5'-phosphate oxidase family protein